LQQCVFQAVDVEFGLRVKNHSKRSIIHSFNTIVFRGKFFCFPQADVDADDDIAHAGYLWW
jgi:hypothetical protein